MSNEVVFCRKTGKGREGREGGEGGGWGEGGGGRGEGWMPEAAVDGRLASKFTCCACKRAAAA
jgi:hypothetical protein